MVRHTAQSPRLYFHGLRACPRKSPEVRDENQIPQSKESTSYSQLSTVEECPKSLVGVRQSHPYLRRFTLGRCRFALVNVGPWKGMVPKKGLEPPHPCGYMDLNHARLPIPPLRLALRPAALADYLQERSASTILQGPSGLSNLLTGITGRIVGTGQQPDYGVA